MPKQMLALSLLFCLSKTNIYAWDGLGHMTVADLAYQNLTARVRKEVDRLVKMNPLYKTWIQNVPKADRGLRAFMMAATWPHIIKRGHVGNVTYVSDGPDNGNRPPPGPQATQNIGYSDLNMHKYWFFVDKPFSCDGTPLQDPADANALTRIDTFRNVLASPRPAGMSQKNFDKLKSYDLVWLLHIVGDVHQPLHCTSRFTATQRDGDAGGNLVAITCPTCSGRLHAFWDDVLGPGADLNQALTTAQAMPPADPSLATVLTTDTWVNESFALAQSTSYASPIACGPGPSALDAGYVTQAHETASKQAALAAARLAGTLNEVLK